MKREKHFYGQLFFAMFYLSAFTFGGGYVIVPLMQKKFVEELGWLEREEMLNLTALAQSSPGAIAVNVAIMVGHRLAGFAGAGVAVLGTVLPPLLILSVISLFYDAFRENAVVSAVLKGMQAGVAAVIAEVVLCLGGNVLRQKQPLSVVLMGGAFCAVFFFRVNVMLVLLICGLLGAMRLLWAVRRGKGGNG